jgi:hypothetical protein
LNPSQAEAEVKDLWLDGKNEGKEGLRDSRRHKAVRRGCWRTQETGPPHHNMLSSTRARAVGKGAEERRDDARRATICLLRPWLRDLRHAVTKRQIKLHLAPNRWCYAAKGRARRRSNSALPRPCLEEGATNLHACPRALFVAPARGVREKAVRRRRWCAHYAGREVVAWEREGDRGELNE